ncbi:hypothetical protein KY285_026415 [Solanum tuberosum]|nr:hypothetical protein KY285_026415 [Solanum tuberosum]
MVLLSWELLQCAMLPSKAWNPFIGTISSPITSILLLSKLYNLRQGSKSVVSYYDEFQNIILKLKYTENEEHAIICFKVGLNKEISSKMTIQKFVSLNDNFEAANEVEPELKEEKNKGGAQTSSGWNKNKDLQKPYEKKPFEGNNPKYPPREGEEGGHLMRECPNCLNVLVQGGELYIGEGVDQEEGCEEETQEEGEFECDEDEEQGPCEGKDVVVPNGLMRKAPIEEAWSQEGEFIVPMYVVR